MSYRDNKVWQLSMELSKVVYSATIDFPKQEIYGLTGQLRRAAVSIPANVAEGYGRGTTTDYVHFLHMARGSLNELETLLELSHSLGYLKDTDYVTMVDSAWSVRKQLAKLIQSLESK